MPLKLFGKAKKAPPVHESIGRLKETLETLEKREDYLQKKVANELAIAKKNATTNKKAAMMALKRKKQYENQIEKLSGARLTIEQQMMTIENAQVSLEAMNAMRMGAHTMRTIHNHMTVDNVDDTMDEIREQMDIANEINEAISQPLGAELYDEDELEDELAELAAEDELAEQFAAPAAVTQKPAATSTANSSLDMLMGLPSAPSGGLSAEEDELAALEREMAM